MFGIEHGDDDAPHSARPRISAVETDAAPLLNIFTRIADRRPLSLEEQLRLLVGVGLTTLWQWTHQQPPRSSLSSDQRERMAHLIGIDVATHAFYGVGSAIAATHIRRPRTAPNGDGTALDVMLSGMEGLSDDLQTAQAEVGHHLAHTVASATLPNRGAFFGRASVAPAAPASACSDLQR